MIDKDYKSQLKAMHEDGIFNNGLAAYKIVKNFIARVRPESILDFGCGHGALIAVIKEQYPAIQLTGYDPGNPLYDTLPSSPSDVVISTDALEHVEPEFLAETIRALSQLTGKYAFFRIACYPARKTLPDGRNAHLIVEHPVWWKEKILGSGDFIILRERIKKVDKSSKWEGVVGFNYDVIVQKKTFTESRFLMHFCIKHLYPTL